MKKSEFVSVLQTNSFLFPGKGVSSLNDKLMVELREARLGSTLNEYEVISEIKERKSKGKTGEEIAHLIMQKYSIEGEVKVPLYKTCQELIVAMYREINWKVK